MHVTIISNPPLDFNASTKMTYPVADAMAAAGWSVDVEPTSAFTSMATAEGVRVECRGKPLVSDVVFVRSIHEAALAASLEAAGYPVVNGTHPAAVAADKWATTLVLARCGVAQVPTTLLQAGTVLAPAQTTRVVKTLFGSSGVGVHRVPAQCALLPGAEPLLVQPFVPFTGDWRVLVADDTAVAWAVRTPAEGEWRSNLRLGSTWEARAIPEPVAELAIAAVAALGLDYGGVDVLTTDDGAWVLEVNANPGWRGVFPLWGDDLHELYQKAVHRCLRRYGATASQVRS